MRGKLGQYITYFEYLNQGVCIKTFPDSFSVHIL